MRKPKVLPPRIPKREAPKVTIANQERQIKVLIDRCEELRDMTEHYRRNFENAQLSFASERKIFDETCQQFNDKTLAYNRLLGWQDCAREMLAGYPQFPAGITGA